MPSLHFIDYCVCDPGLGRSIQVKKHTIVVKINLHMLAIIWKCLQMTKSTKSSNLLFKLFQFLAMYALQGIEIFYSKFQEILMTKI